MAKFPIDFLYKSVYNRLYQAGIYFFKELDTIKEINDLQSPFETKDTALVAYLLSEGYKEPEVKHTNTECVFCFSETDYELAVLVRNFQSGRATGNIPTFFRNYKRVLRRVHSESW